MLRKLLILGVCAGSSASVPILYQNNRDAVHAWLKEQAAEERVEEAAAQKNEGLRNSVQMARFSSESQAQLPGRKVAVAADPRGHFLAEFKINGRRLPAMIDTGATLVALNHSMARSLGIQLAASDFRYKVETANGTAHAASVTLPSVAIGRIHVESVEAVVLEDGALQAALIGMSFLKRLEKYQVENGAMLLVQ